MSDHILEQLVFIIGDFSETHSFGNYIDHFNVTNSYHLAGLKFIVSGSR